MSAATLSGAPRALDPHAALAVRWPRSPRRGSAETARHLVEARASLRRSWQVPRLPGPRLWLAEQGCAQRWPFPAGLLPLPLKGLHLLSQDPVSIPRGGSLATWCQQSCGLHEALHIG